MESNILGRMLSLLMALLFGMLSLPIYGATNKLEPAQSWDNLKQLQPGTRIQVENMNRDSVKGVFLRVTDENLTFRTSKGERSLRRAEVYRVKNRDKNHHVRNGLIGMGIGAVLWGAAGAASSRCPNCSNASEGSALGGAILGTIGFAFGNHQTVYKVEKIADPKKIR